MEIVSWLAAIIYILAYLLLSLKVISAEKFLYHFLNMLGATGLIINGIVLKDNPNIVVNSVWFIIALYSIINTITATKKIKK